MCTGVFTRDKTTCLELTFKPFRKRVDRERERLGDGANAIKC